MRWFLLFRLIHRCLESVKELHPPQISLSHTSFIALPFRLLLDTCKLDFRRCQHLAFRLLLPVSHRSRPANMAPSRTMTGDTFTDEKSPVSPTNTDTSTLHGDAIIEIGEDHDQTVVVTPDAVSPVSGGAAQPGRLSRSSAPAPDFTVSPLLFSCFMYWRHLIR